MYGSIVNYLGTLSVGTGGILTAEITLNGGYLVGPGTVEGNVNNVNGIYGA